jgi:hypothetical protein
MTCQHCAIKKIGKIVRVRVNFYKTDLFYINIIHYDNEGYYLAGKSFTLKGSSDFHSTYDYYQKIIEYNNLTELY